jgi:hypothetical protein
VTERVIQSERNRISFHELDEKPEGEKGDQICTEKYEKNTSLCERHMTKLAR